jgi:CMP-N,N'-diacetyllegionaminic acid synthase
MCDARLLAIIPARGGSKRLPQKNIRLLGGRPLVAWSIRSALEAELFCDVLVSTEDQRVAEAAKAAGAFVPWLRPADLASDEAATTDVLHHAVTWYEASRGDIDGVMLLQPTCPFRSLESLRGAAFRFLQQPIADRRPVVSVSPSSDPPEWYFRVVEGLLDPLLGWEQIGLKSQDLKPSFKLNGSIYVIPVPMIRNGGKLIVPGSIAFTMGEAEEAVDIDTEQDWQMAEFFLERRQC